MTVLRMSFARYGDRAHRSDQMKGPSTTREGPGSWDMDDMLDRKVTVVTLE